MTLALENTLTFWKIRHDLLEDKAADLLVLKKSFQSIDYDIAIQTFDWILEAYDSNNQSKMANKIAEIEGRGRYTH